MAKDELDKGSEERIQNLAKLAKQGVVFNKSNISL